MLYESDNSKNWVLFEVDCPNRQVLLSLSGITPQNIIYWSWFAQIRHSLYDSDDCASVLCNNYKAGSLSLPFSVSDMTYSGHVAQYSAWLTWIFDTISDALGHYASNRCCQKRGLPRGSQSRMINWSNNSDADILECRLESIFTDMQY